MPVTDMAESCNYCGGASQVACYCKRFKGYEPGSFVTRSGNAV
jgi:hypothetical protein